MRGFAGSMFGGARADMSRVAFAVALTVAWAIGFIGTAAAQDVPVGTLSLPAACVLGKDCYLQNYVDVDTGATAVDHACGQMTYDGHKGTDIRPAPGSRFDVVSPADGTVLRARDGEPDRRFSEPLDFPEGRDCGNGLVIDHGAGLTTQHCHLEEGSVRVAPGEAVTRGEKVGVAGASGNVAFPHVHMTVRVGDRVIAPFLGRPVGEAECGRGGEPLWTDAAQAALDAAGRTHIIALGFHDGPVTIEMIEDGDTRETLGAGAPALVAYALAIGLEDGDMHRLVVEGPGVSIDDIAPISGRAQTMRFAGRRAEDGLAAGTYSAFSQILRDGEVVAARETTLTVR